MLVTVENTLDSVHLSVQPFYSLCQLSSGDEFGYLVNTSWHNQTAPLFKSSLHEVTVYYDTGMEQIFKSRPRYEQLLQETIGKVARCVAAYDSGEDSFEVIPPRSSLELPWRATLLRHGMHGDELTKMILYRPVHEGLDDAHYLSDTIRINANYRKRYYD